MKKLINITLILFFSVSSISWANSTICKLEKSRIGIKAIAWDDNTGIAKITDELNNLHNGIVTLSRQHNGTGNKTNIYIKYPRPYSGSDAAEFVIFPVGKNNFRVIGVTYVLKNQKKFLNTYRGNYSATCLSM